MMFDKSILNGFVDLHVHAGPSVAKRSFDSYEMLEEAKEYGYKAFVIKDHYIPSVMTANVLEKHFGGGVRVLGGVVLNNSVGGLNLKVIDTCYNMGARIIWMPTVSAHWDINTRTGKFVGGGDSSVPEEPIYILTENGELGEDAAKLLKYLAEHKDIVLATGHISPAEITVLVREASAMGIDKILINHPYNTVKATFEETKSWADMGAYIELTAVCFKGVLGSEKFDIGMLREYFDSIPLEQFVISSDVGAMTKAGPLYAAEATLRFLNLLGELGITEEQINVMAKTTPSKLLGL
jgi:hypothetical protein